MPAGGGPPRPAPRPRDPFRRRAGGAGVPRSGPFRSGPSPDRPGSRSRPRRPGPAGARVARAPARPAGIGRAELTLVPARPAGIPAGGRAGPRPGQLGSGGPGSGRSRPRRPPSPRPGSRRAGSPRPVAPAWVTPGRVAAARITPRGIFAARVTAPGPRSRLVHAERGIVVRPVRIRHVKLGIGPGQGAPGRPAILPEGTRRHARARGPGIIPVRFVARGSPTQREIRPRAVTIRGARIGIVPSWVGHLVSDVSRCGSITSASR